MKKTMIFALTSLAILAGCQGKQQAEPTEKVAEEQERVELVKVSTLTKQEIQREIELSTNLQGYETVNVAPSLQGKIEHIFVEVGDKVNKGQMLVRMDQNQYKTTKLTYANLGVEMSRMEALIASGSVSQQTYDKTKLSYDQTKESLDFLEINTYVKAPFAGVISAKNYEDGELYAGQAVVVLTQISKLKALVGIPETYFPNVKAGMKVELMTDIYPEKVFPATIEVVYPTIDAATHTFQCKLQIPNAKELLRPGMYVKTRIGLGKANAVVVPYHSVQKLVGSNERFVFLNDNGRAKRVPVQLGKRFDDKVEITGEGIEVGAELVTTGQGKLVDGVKLNIAE